MIVIGSQMSAEEWERTRGHRMFLAFERVGLRKWARLTDTQKDEAVRREAEGRDGERYARECLGVPDSATVAPLVSRRSAGDAGHRAGCPRDHLLTEACADLSQAGGAPAGA